MSTSSTTSYISEDVFKILNESSVWWETILGPDGKILFISKACEPITGYSATEFLKDPELLKTIIYPDDRAMLMDYLNQERELQFNHSVLEFRIITRSGDTKWLTHDCVPVYNKEGGYLGKRITIIEQTAAQRTFSILTEKNNIINVIHKSITDSSGESFLDSLVQGIIRGFKADYGLIAETVIREHPALRTLSFMHQGEKLKNVEYEANKYVLENIFKKRESIPFHEKFCFEKPQNNLEAGTYYFHGINLLDNRKNSMGLLALFTVLPFRNPEIIDEILLSFAPRASAEIERTRAESMIRESEEKYKLIVENQTDLVIKIDRNGRYLFVSPSYCETFGKKESELLGQLFWESIFPEERQDVAKIMETLHDPPYTCHVEHRTETLLGWRWMAWNNKAILDDQRHIQEIICIGRDITERKNSELELIQAKHKAEESDRLKTAFLANMSHEIRTPMNSILGFSGLLSRENIQPEKKKQYIDIIQNSTKQLLTVINDIIDIAKIEAGQISLSPETVNLNKLCSQLYVFFDTERRIRNKSDIELIFVPGFHDTDAEVTTDGIRLQQIITNLLSNALKFTESGYIRYGYRKQSNSSLLFFVEDTGKGIPEEKHQLIFQRFRQEEETFSRQYGGTGLGLSICKGLIDLFQGKLWVESTPGQGSVFYFTIPLQLNDTGREKEEAEIEASFFWKDKTILIAEDTQSNLYFLTELLSETECRILHAENGAKALSLTQEYPGIHLILMDIQMPVMNGYDATRAIRKFNKHIPIIAQTAYAMSEDRSKCLDAGCNDYLAKPFDRSTFLNLLNHYLT